MFNEGCTTPVYNLNSDWEARRNITVYASRIYDLGLVAATDGNISTRFNFDRIMITPSGKSLANLNPDELAFVDNSGNILDHRNTPSSELPMHRDIYKYRPDINAIIHAHPPYATALTVAGESMSEAVLPEVYVMLGRIPTASYATPSTEESAQVISELIKNHEAILLDHHGAVTCGKTLEEAFFKMEKVEHAAKTLIAAHSLGKVIPLSEEKIEKLSRVKYSYLHSDK